MASEDGESLDFDRLYRTADTALYEAKQSGRNSVRVCAVEPEPTLA